jgi:hypothetical protein
MRKNIFGGINYFVYFLIAFFVVCLFYFMTFRRRNGLLEGYKEGAATKRPAAAKHHAKHHAKHPAKHHAKHPAKHPAAPKKPVAVKKPAAVKKK